MVDISPLFFHVCAVGHFSRRDSDEGAQQSASRGRIEAHGGQGHVLGGSGPRPIRNTCEASQMDGGNGAVGVGAAGGAWQGQIGVASRQAGGGYILGGEAQEGWGAAPRGAAAEEDAGERRRRALEAAEKRMLG